jgi:hypothetical protein
MNDDVERDEPQAPESSTERVPDAEPGPEPGPTPEKIESSSPERRGASPEPEETPPEADEEDDDENDDEEDDDDFEDEEGVDGQDDSEGAPSPGGSWSSHPPPSSESGRGTFRDSDLFRHQRKRLESTLREVIRKAVEKGVDAGVGAIEQSVDVIERSMEAGRGRVKSANSAIRDVIEEVKIPKDLPKDIASMILGQIEEGKNVLVGAVASEVRGFLEETDVAHELQRVLTSLSFEISTEIRFVPNERGVPKAEVRSKARPKVSSRRARRRRPSEEPELD